MALANLVGVERTTSAAYQCTDSCATSSTNSSAKKRAAACAHSGRQFISVLLPESATVAIAVIDAALSGILTGVNVMTMMSVPRYGKAW